MLTLGSPNTESPEVFLAIYSSCSGQKYSIITEFLFVNLVAFVSPIKSNLQDQEKSKIGIENNNCQKCNARVFMYIIA